MHPPRILSASPTISFCGVPPDMGLIAIVGVGCEDLMVDSFRLEET